MINFLPLNCAISPLPGEQMLSFASRALWQQRCWRRKRFSLPDLMCFSPRNFYSSWLQFKAASSTQQQAASPGTLLVGSQQILRNGTSLWVVSPDDSFQHMPEGEFPASSSGTRPAQLLCHSMNQSHTFTKEIWISALAGVGGKEGGNTTLGVVSQQLR